MNKGPNDQHYLQSKGSRVPALGFGTYTLRERQCYEGVRDAIDIGYRHIDTAEMYQNEEFVGKAVKESGVSRESVFVTTKIWYTNLRKSDAIQAAENSLRKLQLDHVDLLLVHWPNPAVPLEETLEAMLKLKEQGKTSHIGVSNFTPALLKKALAFTPLFALQVEYHPFLSQEELHDIVRANDMILTAYSPLAQGRVSKAEKLQDIGQRHHKSASQVALRWLMQQEKVAAIPRAASHAHRKDNFDIFDFSLSAAEMNEISSLESRGRLVNPSFAPDWDE